MPVIKTNDINSQGETDLGSLSCNTGSNNYNPITAAAVKLSQQLQIQRKKLSNDNSELDEDLEFDFQENDELVSPLKGLSPFTHRRSANLNSYQQLSPTIQENEVSNLFNRLKNLVPRTAGATPEASPKPLRKTSVPGTPFETNLAESQPKPSRGDYFSTGGVVVNRSTKMPFYNNFFFRSSEVATGNRPAGNTGAGTEGAVALATDGAVQRAGAGTAKNHQQPQQQPLQGATATITEAEAALAHERRCQRATMFREMNLFAPTAM